MLNIQPRPAQVVVDLTADHVERANLWIPEIVEVGASGAFLPFAKSPEHPVAWIREEAKSRYDLRLPGLLSLSASVQADESGFALEIEIGNSAAEDWGEVHACICLQLTPAASFLDLGWERTWCVVGGQLVRVAEMEKIGRGNPFYLFSMLDGHQAPLRHRDPHRAGAKWRFTEASPDHGFICVTSVDASKTVWMGWEDVQYLQCNAASAYGCIHTNPYFGDIGEGERVSRRGRVSTVEGGAQAALESFLEEFG